MDWNYHTYSYSITVAPGQAYPLDYINELIFWELNPFVVPNNAFISKKNLIADWTMRTRDAPYMENRSSRPISTWRRWWQRWVNQKTCYKYRKSHERECISWFMGTSDVLKVFKIARAVGECNFKIFKNITSGHKSRIARAVHAILCLLYSQQNHSVSLLYPPWRTLLETLFRFPKCSYVLFETQLQQLRQTNQA